MRKRSLSLKSRFWQVAAAIVCAIGVLSSAMGIRSAASDQAARVKLPVLVLSRAERGLRSLPRLEVARPRAQAASSSFDKCVQDDSDPSKILLFNSTSGAFQFTWCVGSKSLSGTGTITNPNGILTLTYRTSTGQVSAGLTNSGTTATAVVTLINGGVSQTIRLNDSNTANDTGSTIPAVTVLTPNGGEILDAGSSFGINWTTSGTGSIVSQDVMYSTDGGNTFTTIVTGLAPSVTSYTWAVPAIANSQNAKIKVVEHDAFCSMEFASSASPFTIWNPGSNFTHVAEAPFYVISDEHNSTATLTNISASSVTVELTMRTPSHGNAPPKLPTVMTLGPRAVVNVNLATLLNIPASSTTDPNVIMGSVRLRHNGSNDTDVAAVIANDHLGIEQSFTTPFVYPTTFQSSSDGNQMGPMYYIGTNTSCWVAIQNTTNNIIPLTATVNYGTGGSSPGGSDQLPIQVLYPQETVLTDIAAFGNEFSGTQWGSIALNAPPQSVVAHCVNISGSGGFAFNSNFVAQAEQVGTTKVASPLKIDPVNGHTAYVMVCNTSSASKTVTATFNTANGVTIPAQTLTIPADSHQMIEITPQQVSAATYADVRLTYSGSPSDIVAGACSMSPTDSRALAASFVEPKASDGRDLISPLFKMSPSMAGIVQISNVTSSDVKVGVKMRFAGSSASPGPTSLVTVPANGTSTVNLQDFADRVPDATNPTGSLELVQSGSAGSVTASFTTLGNDGKTPISLGDPFQQGPQIPGVSLFPVSAVIIPGGCTEMDAITDGTTMATAQVSSPDQCFGEFIQTFQSLDGSVTVQTAPICVPIACDSGVVLTPPPGGDPDDLGPDKLGAGLQFSGGPLDPDGTAQFAIVQTNTNKPFPSGTINVEFDDASGNAVTTALPVSIAPDNLSITGTAPLNNAFIGDVSVIRILLSGQSKAIGKVFGAAVYAYPAPTGISISPNAQNRLGGLATVSGSGFRVFTPASGSPVFPIVSLSGISFKLSVGSIVGNAPATLPGNVRLAFAGMRAGSENLKVSNPGGQDAGLVTVATNAYTLQTGPAPSDLTLNVHSGFSSGGTQLIINGVNTFVVNQISIGGVVLDQLQITNTQNGTITAITPPSGSDPTNLCPPGTYPIQVSDIDGANVVQAGMFSLLPSLAVSTHTVNGLTVPVSPGPGIKEIIFQDVSATVGPCSGESLAMPMPSSFSFPAQGTQANCATVTVTPTLVSSSATGQTYTVRFLLQSTCTGTASIISQPVTLTNTAAGAPTQVISVSAVVRPGP